MSREIITVDEQTPVIEVVRIFDENGIGHLPVIRKGALVGLITDNEVKEASPSKKINMNARELYRFLGELKASDIMKKEPIVLSPSDTVEVAAVKMLEHKVTGIPVVSEDFKVIGIITMGDVFRVMISITGIYQRGVQFAFNLEDRAGSIKEVADIIREENGQIVSILSTKDTADEGYRHVFIRIATLKEKTLKRLTEKLDRNFMLLYVIKDPIKTI